MPSVSNLLSPGGSGHKVNAKLVTPERIPYVFSLVVFDLFIASNTPKLKISLLISHR